MAEIQVTFLADDGSEMDAGVEDSMTDRQIIEQLIATGFVPTPGQNQVYTLGVKGGSQIPAGQSLRQASVSSGAIIRISTSQMGGSTGR